ncbi:MAG: gliding motility-associated ABC transporter substrate-binding protein GldG [Bacteroidetes bacterium]|nr:MAG: gliding motility-associated ABC transporter substrate-binding protein GldG [Bacteroidota bacterium]
MKKKPLLLRWIGAGLLGTLALIYASSFLPGRADLTAEGRYTLSPATKQLLAGLQAPVTVTVLLQGSQLPAGFTRLAMSTQAFLAQCERQNPANFRFRFVNPDQFVTDSVLFPLNDSAKQGWLKANAIKQTEQVESGTKAVFIYPLALVEYDGGFAPVNLLQGQGNKGFLNPGANLLQSEVINNAEAQMEYQFASSVASLVQNRIPIVAYSIGNGQPQGPETYDLNTTLQAKYRFFLLNLNTEPFISDSIKALLMVKPTLPFTDLQKLKLDQYLMRGGRLLLAVDQLNAGMDTLMANGSQLTAFSRNLNLDDLLFKYGVRINNDLVQDRQADMLPQNVGSVGGQPQIELLPWPYFPLLYSSTNHPIAKNLDAVVMQFPNSIDTVKAEGIEKNILLASSNTSRVEGAPALVSVNVLKQNDNASAYQQAYVPLAVLLEGRFKSLYANRMGPAQIDSMQAAGRPFLTTGSAAGKVLVTGDADWVLNGVTRKGPLPMGVNPYTQYQFANKDFLLNSLEYLTDETGIMATRGKSFTLRVLDPKRLETQKQYWQWFNIGLPLLLLLLLAAVLGFWRRQKYTRATLAHPTPTQ